MLLLALSAPALATMPTWKWEAGKEYRYHLESEFRQPDGVKVKAVTNEEADAMMLHFSLDALCIPKASGKSTELNCTLPHVKVTGLAWSTHQDTLDGILTAYNDRYKSAKIYILLGPDGRIKEFDLDGMPRKSTREGQINELLRLYAMRTFSILHLPLPSDPKDFVRGWMDPSAISMVALPSESGTVGSVELKHIEDGTAYGLTRVVDSIAGTVAEGADVEFSVNKMLDVRGAGTALLDAEKGEITWREYTMDARYTASAERNGSGASLYQYSSIQKVDAFNEDGSPPLPISALRQPKVSTTPADPPVGVPLVAFSTLGMAPLFMIMPPEKAQLGLPPSTIKARLEIDTNGGVTKVGVYSGYEVLVETFTMAIKGASFPKQAGPYAVDVDVEMRPK